VSVGKTYVIRRGVVAMPNRTVHDAHLSYAALGVLTVLLARPDGAPAGYRELMGRGLGEDAMRAALRELDAQGYRHLVRRHGERGRLVTDVVVSEVPLSPEEAREQLDERLGVQTLTVPGIARHGVTRGNAASSQVAPRLGSPEHGGPRHGESRHKPSASKVTLGLRPESPDNPSAHAPGGPCPHDDPHGLDPTPTGLPRCPMCRRGLDLPGADVIPFDTRARAAGDHLEARS
jgi:hypothetical protein